MERLRFSHISKLCVSERVRAAQVLSSTIIISRTSSISSSCESIFVVIIFTFLSWRAVLLLPESDNKKSKRSVKRKIEKSVELSNNNI